MFPLEFVTFVIFAVVPVTLKSAVPTLLTASLNVTFHLKVFEFVGLVVGFWRVILVIRGAVLSNTKVLLLVPVGVKLFSKFPAESSMF